MSYDDQNGSHGGTTRQDSATSDVAHPSSGPPTEGQSKGGAPIGNDNARKLGLRSTKLGKDERHIERKALALRRGVEEYILGAGGCLDLPTLLTLDTALKQAISSMRAERTLRLHADRMSIDQQAECSERIGKAAEARDRALAKIGVAPKAALTPAEMLAQFHREDAAREAQEGDVQSDCTSNDKRAPEATDPTPTATGQQSHGEPEPDAEHDQQTEAER